MFKNIQKYLLINQPLLWNLKIVPLTAFAIIFHLVFFILGYYNGGLNFTESENSYSFNAGEGTLIFFSVLLSIISLILWLVFYFKNNALKTFYPKNNFSLFKEWLLILLSCLLIVTFLVSYFYGKETRVRSYFSEIEAKKRCETLAMGSFFVNGSYAYYQNNFAVEAAVEAVAVDTAAIAIDSAEAVQLKTHFTYKGKSYSNNSLLNKNINDYSFFDSEKDSILKERIKTWLVNNQKDSVRKLMKNYLKIAKEHDLKASIDENKWLELTYDYPNFEIYKTIGSEERDIYYQENFNNNNAPKIDTTEQYIRTINNQEYLYNKFYVPEKQLHYSYKKIADSYNNPDINWATFLISLYVAFGISLLVFSFRVTSGRNWLIAVVSLGIINIIMGIITAIFGSQYVYFSGILLLFLSLFGYFLVVIYRKKSKGISGITINAMLWMLPAFTPIVYYLVIEIAKELSGYNDAFGESRDIIYPRLTYFQDTNTLFVLTYLNLVFVVLIMLVLSRKIKQWRGVAEA